MAWYGVWLHQGRSCEGKIWKQSLFFYAKFSTYRTMVLFKHILIGFFF